MREKLTVGWTEYVDFPEWGVRRLGAKRLSLEDVLIDSADQSFQPPESGEATRSNGTDHE